MAFTKTFTTELGDYQKVRVETITLVNHVSNAATGFGNLQPGIHLVYPCEHLSDDGKLSTRIFLISPTEIVKNTVREDDVSTRIFEIIESTPIRRDVKGNTDIYLDPNSHAYTSMHARLVQVIQVAMQNFRRDVAELLPLFDACTQPGKTLPSMQSFHLRAAFEYRQLLGAYRLTNNLPVVAPATLEPEVREALARRGISAHDVPDRGAAVANGQGLLHQELPEAPKRLRDAQQGGEYGKEVQMILHLLGDAIVKGEIPPLVMSAAFREGLQQVVQDARNQPPGGEGAPHHPAQ